MKNTARVNSPEAKLTEIFEQIARERYPHLLEQPNGLARAFCAVFSSAEDRAEAIHRFKITAQNIKKESTHEIPPLDLSNVWS